MTWSIIARDSATGEIGIAVATRFFAVGSLVPYIDGRAGAIATQALVNPYFGIDGLQYLRDGCYPDDILRCFSKMDSGYSFRQVHLMSREGRVAAHTGSECLGWCGHRSAESVSVAGNTLAGPEVIEATEEAYACGEGSFALRLIGALEAGERAGGDLRGRQSAALLIARGDEWPALDLRVDDHADPIAELRRLEGVSRQEWLVYRSFVPTRSNPSGMTDYEEMERETQRPISDHEV